MKLKITKKDLDMLVIAPPGWYRSELISVTDKPSKDKKSMVAELSFNLQEDSDGIKADKDILHWVSEKGLGFHIQLIESILGRALQAEDEFEFDDYIGVELWLKIANEPSSRDEKRMVAVIDDSSPIGEPPF